MDKYMKEMQASLEKYPVLLPAQINPLLGDSPDRPDLNRHNR